MTSDEETQEWVYHFEEGQRPGPGDDDSEWVTHDGDPTDKAIYLLEDIVAVLNGRERALESKAARLEAAEAEGVRWHLACDSQVELAAEMGTILGYSPIIDRKEGVLGAAKRVASDRTTYETLLRQVMELVRDFARSEHRERFPHVKPDAREEKADLLITAIASALGEVKE